MPEFGSVIWESGLVHSFLTAAIYSLRDGRDELCTCYEVGVTVGLVLIVMLIVTCDTHNLETLEHMPSHATFCVCRMQAIILPSPTNGNR